MNFSSAEAGAEYGAWPKCYPRSGSYVAMTRARVELDPFLRAPTMMHLIVCLIIEWMESVILWNFIREKIYFTHFHKT